MSEGNSWLDQKLDRRLLLAGGLAAAGGTVVATGGARGQSGHVGHGMTAAAGAEAAPAHLAAHGAMITVGEVDDARRAL